MAWRRGSPHTHPEVAGRLAAPFPPPSCWRRSSRHRCSSGTGPSTPERASRCRRLAHRVRPGVVVGSIQRGWPPVSGRAQRTSVPPTRYPAALATDTDQQQGARFRARDNLRTSAPAEISAEQGSRRRDRQGRTCARGGPTRPGCSAWASPPSTGRPSPTPSPGSRPCRSLTLVPVHSRDHVVRPSVAVGAHAQADGAVDCGRLGLGPDIAERRVLSPAPAGRMRIADPSGATRDLGRLLGRGSCGVVSATAHGVEPPAA